MGNVTCPTRMLVGENRLCSEKPVILVILHGSRSCPSAVRAGTLPAGRRARRREGEVAQMDSVWSALKQEIDHCIEDCREGRLTEAALRQLREQVNALWPKRQDL